MTLCCGQPTFEHLIPDRESRNIIVADDFNFRLLMIFNLLIDDFFIFVWN